MTGSSSSLRPARRRQLVAGVVSVAAVTLGAAFVGGDLGETAPVAPTGGDLFAARYASGTSTLTDPASILGSEVAAGLPGTGFFQPVSNVRAAEPAYAGPGLAGLLVGSSSSRTTISGFSLR